MEGWVSVGVGDRNSPTDSLTKATEPEKQPAVCTGWKGWSGLHSVEGVVVSVSVFVCVVMF